MASARIVVKRMMLLQGRPRQVTVDEAKSNSDFTVTDRDARGHRLLEPG
jgi:hypothetical protein